MDSIDPACNPLKHRYDACFIKWIEGYLEPPSSPSGAAGGKAAAVDQQARAKAKADEYEQLCGESWRAYSSCVWKAVKKKDLLPLLTQAREDNPLLVPPAGIDGPGAATTSL